MRALDSLIISILFIYFALLCAPEGAHPSQNTASAANCFEMDGSPPLREEDEFYESEERSELGYDEDGYDEDGVAVREPTKSDARTEVGSVQVSFRL